MARTSDKTKAGLPGEAFAIIGESGCPDTWHLPHHRKSIARALRGKVDIEETVDWEQMAVAVGSLSLHLHHGQKIEASPEEILEAAKHLALHYQTVGKKLPDVLAALI
ncbi:hypothetical protein ACFLXF_03745 [Chloroflexota bacterium]